MSTSGPSALGPVLIRLSKVHALSPDDLEALNALPFTIRDYPADQDILREGERATQCFVVLDGLTCRYRVVNDGRRQILAVNVPGDLPDFLALHLSVMDHSLATLVPSTLGFVSHGHVKELCEQRPAIAIALWRETQIDAAALRAWLFGIGRMPARARLAHFLCELLLRLRVVGLAEEFRFELPLTQQEIGDALGLSVVHVNRILQDLRSEGLIAVSRRIFTIRNWNALRAIGHFDPTYLHLTPEIGSLGERNGQAEGR